MGEADSDFVPEGIRQAFEQEVTGIDSSTTQDSGISKADAAARNTVVNELIAEGYSVGEALSIVAEASQKKD